MRSVRWLSIGQSSLHCSLGGATRRSRSCRFHAAFSLSPPSGDGRPLADSRWRTFVVSVSQLLCSSWLNIMHMPLRMQFDNSQTTLASVTGRASAITDAPPTTQAQGPGLSWSLVRKNSASLPGSLGIDKTCDQALALVETGVQVARSSERSTTYESPELSGNSN